MFGLWANFHLPPTRVNSFVGKINFIHLPITGGWLPYPAVVVERSSNTDHVARKS